MIEGSTVVSELLIAQNLSISCASEGSVWTERWYKMILQKLIISGASDRFSVD